MIKKELAAALLIPVVSLGLAGCSGDEGDDFVIEILTGENPTDPSDPTDPTDPPDDPTDPPDDPTDPVCFPLESNHTQVGTGDLTPSWPFGWCFLNLNHSFSGSPGGAPWPPGGGDIAQSYVSVSHDALGRFSVGYSAIELTSACSVANPTISTTIAPVDPPTLPD